MNRMIFVTVFVLLASCMVPVFSQTTSNNVIATANPPMGTYAEGFNLGSMSAGSSTWYGVGSLVSGCCVGGLMPADMGWGVPLVSAAAGSIPIIAAAVSTPQPQPYMVMSMESKGPDYINGFRDGYSKAKKSKNMSTAALGMGLSVAIAIGTVVLIQSAEEDEEELKWAP